MQQLSADDPLCGRLKCPNSRVLTNKSVLWSLDIFYWRLVNLSRGLVEVEPGPYCCATHPFSRASFPVASGVPAGAQFPPRSATSFRFIDRGGNRDAHAHPGGLRFGPAGLERRVSPASPQ